jgi:hypothetical protein
VHNFGAFLRIAISEGRQGRFARKQFRHAVGGIYLERGQLEATQRQLNHFATARAELPDVDKE